MNEADAPKRLCKCVLSPTRRCRHAASCLKVNAAFLAPVASLDHVSRCFMCGGPFDDSNAIDRCVRCSARSYETQEMSKPEHFGLRSGAPWNMGLRGCARPRCETRACRTTTITARPRGRGAMAQSGMAPRWGLLVLQYRCSEISASFLLAMRKM